MKISFLIILTFLPLLLCRNLHSQNFWQKTNGPSGGVVPVIAYSSTGEIFAGTSSGIFRSDNNGGTWTLKSNGLSGSVKAILTSSNFIFAGTDDGVFRSSDNGDTWLAVNNGLSVLKVTSLAKNSAGVLFAGAYDFNAFSGGIFRSTDNGENWTASSNGINFPSILTLIAAQNGYLFAGLTVSGGIYRSTNNGDNWNRVYEEINVQSFAINSDGNIFASYNGGILRSTDNGSVWTKITNGLTTPWIYSLFINSGNEIYAGGLAAQSREVLFHSVNNGDTWAPLNALQVTAVLHISGNGNNLFAGTDMGVLRSSDNGNSWIVINNGITASNVSSLQINKEGYIFTGYPGTGVSRSTDNGNTWEVKNNGLDLSVQCLAVNDSGHIFAGTYDAGLFRSTNNGDNWIQVYDPSYHVIYSVAINDSNYIYAEVYTAYGSRVLKSTDNGLSWTQKNNGLSDNNDVLSFAFNSDGYIFAGTSNDGVFRSTDYGENWTAVNNGYNVPYAGRLEAGPNGYIYASPYYNVSGIYRSTNNGDIWEGCPIDSDSPVQSLETNSNGDLFAGTYTGIYKSTDNGQTWTQINNGLTNNTVLALAVDSNGFVFAGTQGGGVFRSSNSTTSVHEKNEIIPGGYSLSQNYPNPFNPTTTISFALPADGLVKLKIYDPVGNEITTLIDEFKSAGSYNVLFNGENLSSGVYYYRITINGYSEVKKLMMLK